MSIDVDTREFQAAMKEAIRTSSRSAATVINGKHQDLLYKAARQTPSAKKSYKRQFILNPPAFVTYLATRIHGQGFKRAQRSAIFQNWYGSKAGRKFLAAGYLNAGKEFKLINAVRAGKETPPSIERAARPIRASIRQAAGAGRVQVSSSEIRWKAKDKRPDDGGLKSRVLMNALRRGMAVVTADTRRHMANKLAKELAKLSAKGAR